MIKMTTTKKILKQPYLKEAHISYKSQPSNNSLRFRMCDEISNSLFACTSVSPNLYCQEISSLE